MKPYRLAIGPLVVLLLALAAAEAGAARKAKKPRTEDLINFYLGLEFSQWLVGPIYYIATEEERAAYLALTSDEQARAFTQEFWKRRDPEPEIFGNPTLDLYERRVEIADRRYREQAIIGRRTDRGAVFVVYGEPEMIQYDSGTSPRDPDLEIWIYPKTADASLNGDRPKRRYFFAEKDGKTVLYTPRASRRLNVPQ